LDVISINIGSNLSTTVEAAKKAAKVFSGRVSVWDSGAGSMAQGLMAIMA
jgi:fatty acid-binding protein DegV